MLINKDRIFLNTNYESKDEVFEFISEVAKGQNLIKDKNTAIKDFIDREKQISTGLQDGFSIPHCRSDNVIESSVFYINNSKEIEWETLDNSKVKYIIAILVPKEGTENSYLELIADIARNLLEEDFKYKLMNLKDKDELLKLFSKE